MSTMKINIYFSSTDEFCARRVDFILEFIEPKLKEWLAELLLWKSRHILDF